MTPSDVAKELLRRIDAPRGVVSVFAEPEPTAGYILRVWLSNNSYVSKVPAEFLGHPVVVQKPPRISPTP